MAAPAAAVVAAAVVEEPPVLAVVALVDLAAHLPVLALAQVVARRAHRVQLPRLPLARALLADLVPAALPVLADLVDALAVAVLQLLLSRQWFSAAMARSTP